MSQSSSIRRLQDIEIRLPNLFNVNFAVKNQADGIFKFDDIVSGLAKIIIAANERSLAVQLLANKQ